MDPIISPVWIYLIYIADRIWGFSIFVLIAAMFVILSLMVGWIEFDEPNSEELRRKWMKIFAIVAIVCILIIMIIPDKNMMYTMLAASFVTPDNISAGEEHLIDLVTKIAKIINTPK